SKHTPYPHYYFFTHSQHPPPTNSQSKFPPNPSQYHQKTHQYYFHLFHLTQPHLNSHNPDLTQPLYQILNYWIHLGLHAFRFHLINLI
ncbi:alpha-amylase family glycosyl hydrolase, partial [Staphylococcus warneri]|uniref:alpha-amylase family glycosyl hydrolase n=1 Tax=Staphylococcus warneri TaxID=1292 RepID=UPI003704491C